MSFGREGRLTGKYIANIRETSDALEIAKKVSGLDLDTNSKNMLFVVTQVVGGTNKIDLTQKLKMISEDGHIFPNYSFSKIIEEKLDELNKLSKEEMMQIAKTLLNKIENDEIKL